jgi:hypothetical protein
MSFFLQCLGLGAVRSNKESGEVLNLRAQVYLILIAVTLSKDTFYG